MDRPNPTRTAVGLLLIAPAAIALVFSYVLPTLWTLWTSTQKATLLQDGEFVGGENFEKLGGQPYGALGFAFLATVLPLLTVLLFAPALAFAAHHSGRPGRWATRLVFVVPMVAFTPVALAAAWMFDRRDLTELGSPGGARVGLMLAFWLTTFGLVLGLAVTTYLAALRGGRLRTIWPAMLVVIGLAALGTLAVGLQLFAYPVVMTGGGPARATQTPLLVAVDFGFRGFQFGAGAAALVPLGIVLGLLGIGATVLIILSRLRLEFDATGPAQPSAGEPGLQPSAGEPHPQPSVGESPAVSTGRVPALVALGVGLVIALGITGYGLWPWLSRLVGGDDIDGGPSAGEVMVDTWVPPLISTVVGVVLAALAAFGIGALRPLGRHSHWLLLIFAPWLFVGIGPLMLAHFNSSREADLLDSFVGLIPPSWLSIPALFIFTLLASGQKRHWSRLRAQGATASAALWRAVIPGLPMLVLVGFAVWLYHAQDLTWQYVAGGGDFRTGPLLVLQVRQEFGSEAAVGQALPATVLVMFALGLAAAQLFYLDRLTLRTGTTDTPVSAPAGSTQDAALGGEGGGVHSG